VKTASAELFVQTTAELFVKTASAELFVQTASAELSVQKTSAELNAPFTSCHKEFTIATLMPRYLKFATTSQAVYPRVATYSLILFIIQFLRTAI